MKDDKPSFGKPAPRGGADVFSMPGGVRPASDSGASARAVSRLNRDLGLDDRSLTHEHRKRPPTQRVVRKVRDIASGARVAGVDSRSPEAVARGLRKAHIDGAGRVISGETIKGGEKVNLRTSVFDR